MTPRPSTSIIEAPSGLNLFFVFINSRTSRLPIDGIKYLNFNRRLRNLYIAPRNFLKQAAQAEDRVPSVSAPPVNGRPG